MKREGLVGGDKRERESECGREFMRGEDFLWHTNRAFGAVWGYV
jgi:hypothetical protein